MKTPATEYKLVDSFSAASLSSEVSRYLANGWRLRGKTKNKNGTFTQAVVR